MGKILNIKKKKNVESSLTEGAIRKKVNVSDEAILQEIYKQLRRKKESFDEDFIDNFKDLIITYHGSYLKIIYLRLMGITKQKVIAEWIGISPAAVCKISKKLIESNLTFTFIDETHSAIKKDIHNEISDKKTNYFQIVNSLRRIDNSPWEYHGETNDNCSGKGKTPDKIVQEALEIYHHRLKQEAFYDLLNKKN